MAVLFIAPVINAKRFAASGSSGVCRLVIAVSGLPADGARVLLNSDLAYPEFNARYFLAACSWKARGNSTVARFDAGVKIVNLDEFERKRVDGQIRITLQGQTSTLLRSLSRSCFP